MAASWQEWLRMNQQEKPGLTIGQAWGMTWKERNFTKVLSLGENYTPFFIHECFLFYEKKCR